MFEVLKLAIGMVKELISFDGKCGETAICCFPFLWGQSFFDKGETWIKTFLPFLPLKKALFFYLCQIFGAADRGIT